MELVAINVRMPLEMKQEAQKLAEEEHRSMNSFAVNAIDEYIRRRKGDEAYRKAAEEGAIALREALDELGK